MASGPRSSQMLLAIILSSVAAERRVLHQHDLDISEQIGADGAAAGSDDEHIRQVIGAAATASEPAFFALQKLVPVDEDAAGVSSGALDPRYDPDHRCPLETKRQRKAAAKAAGGTPQVMYQEYAETKAWLWEYGLSRPLNPASDAQLHHERAASLPLFFVSIALSPTYYNYGSVLEIVKLLPAFVLTDSGNRTSFFNNVAGSNCWNPAPLVDGPMSFKYGEVLRGLIAPEQRRGYYTATAPQIETFFTPQMIIFTDGERHTTYRHLLNSAGFARRYPVDPGLVRAISVRGEDIDTAGMAGVVTATAPVLFAALWGQAPKAETTVGAIDIYGKYGKLGIFGSKIDALLSPVGISEKIGKARKTLSAWVATTPFAELLRAAVPKFVGEDEYFSQEEWLLQDVVDLGLFAGLLGTTDMVHKCVVNQRRDAAHQELFRSQPEKYLIELMRTDSAVTSVTELLREDEQFLMAGRLLWMAAGTPRQLVLATANRDPTHFASPNVFDPFRADLGDSLPWNGRVQDVEARDEANAPRHCPGYCLSLKVGAAVCAQLMGSFEELLGKGKLDTGSEVRCRNFDHKDGKGDNAPLWHPTA